MHVQRLQTIRRNQHYHLLAIQPGMMLEVHEKIGEGNNQRIRKFKWLVLKVRKPSHADGSFTIRGKAAGHTIEKIYPLSFPHFDHVYLVDQYKIARAKLYYMRDKIGKDAKMKSKISATERGMDLLLQAQERADQELPRQSDATPEIVTETPAAPEAAEEMTAQAADTSPEEPTTSGEPIPEHTDDQGEPTPDQVVQEPEQTDGSGEPAHETTPEEPLPEQIVQEDPNQETPGHSEEKVV